MGTDYTPTPQALPVTITIPADGDAPTAAVIAGPHEVELDAIARLEQLVNPGEGTAGTTDVDRQIGLGVVLSVDVNGTIDTFGTTGHGIGNVANTAAGIGDAFNAVIELTSFLPHGSTLSAIAVLVAGGETSAGTPNTMPRMRLYSQSMDPSTGEPPYTEHESATDSAASQAAWEAKHRFTMTVDPGLTINRQLNGNRYYLDLRGEYGALVTQTARYLGFELTFSYDTIDVGAA